MMYNNKLAVALKSAGKVLREFDETVYMPFGKEYSILVKNLNSVKALVKVEIDGVDVGDGTRFILNANNDLELERFIKAGNLDSGNRFKFIERSENVEQHRGIGIEDGIIRIEFNFEKVLHNITTQWHSKTLGLNRGINNTANYSASITGSYDTSRWQVRSVNDAGITVPGSVSDQKFNTGTSFPTEYETHVIVLQMLGETENNQPVSEAITVKAKPKCSTCGRTNKATAKFCTECGTSLTLV